MTHSRRNFIKTSILAGGFTGIGLKEVIAKNDFFGQGPWGDNSIKITIPPSRNYWKPLEEVPIKISEVKASNIKIWDGQGNNYLSMDFKPSFQFKVGGALGYHKVTLHNKSDEVVGWVAFPVDCQTELKDENEEFHELFNVLFETLHGSNYSHGKTVRYNNKYYKYYSSWFQDHVFVAEGMKYFTEDLKSGINLYADGQRKDGLIWDNYKHPYPDIESFWEYRFDYGGFTYRPEDPRSTAIFVRIPVENIGEHTFLEGLYYAWKATGDDRWMEDKLDNALKAVDFVTSSPYYWSDEKKLLKRPFSIDRWDFQSDFDAKITGKDFMGVDLDKTHYGIMFGDNICFANGCKWLAEMLNHVGRMSEASQMEQLSKDIWNRINELSWNGQFYEHWVSLEADRNLDFGVDTSKQVTLSNAMALIRGLDHDKCVEIIKTYQRIKEEMPETSPGEWYMCYPPFERGWHIKKWDYMNGGVSPILAGDLALGAFEHGFETYGIDILRRLHKLSVKTGYQLEGCYKGKMPDAPERSFNTVDLKKYVNADLTANEQTNNPGFGSEIADLRNMPTGNQKFEQVPFNIIDPKKNNHKSCLIISDAPAFEQRVTIPLRQKATSLYLLHTCDTNSIAGIFRIHYVDGKIYSRYINSGEEIAHYWYPKMEKTRKGIPGTIVAWKGPGKVVGELGVYAFGMDNPHPDTSIEKLEFFNEQSSKWAILGITLSDGPHFFEPSIVSTIPDHWASAHVFKALMEGLVGIKNTGVAFNTAVLSPKWELAGVHQVKATAKYVPSGGYLSYEYRKLSQNNYELVFTGNNKEVSVLFPLPENKEIQLVNVNGKEIPFETIKLENTNYMKAKIEHVDVYTMKIGFI